MDLYLIAVKDPPKDWLEQVKNKWGAPYVQPVNELGEHLIFVAVPKGSREIDDIAHEFGMNDVAERLGIVVQMKTYQGWLDESLWTWTTRMESL
jgi:hypothetical protein